MSRYDRYGGEFYRSSGVTKEKIEKSMKKLRQEETDLQPIIIQGRAIATSWWGKAWNANLEHYADYASRIGRGKTYVRSGAVLDLRILKGAVEALVQGSKARPYGVSIQIDAVSQEKWEKVTELCKQRIESLEELSEGKFPEELEILFTDPRYGLFPSPREIHFDCSCPDWASMCKHVAAVLYGIGARLDQDPLLFFELRGRNGHELIRRSMESRLEAMLQNAGKKSLREIPEEDAAALFGLSARTKSEDPV